MERIKQDFGDQFPSILLDGIRVQVTETGWGLVRASNTSPYLTLRFEGSSEEEVLKVKNIFADKLEKYPEIKDTLDRANVASLTGKLGWR